MYKTISEVYKELFGCKVYKLSIDGGMTCPNRDGTVGNKGCIFCSDCGSGEFAEPKCESIVSQLERAKRRVENKIKDGKYIAYFQSFSNTYAPIDYLRKIYTEAISPDFIAGLSVATRPDCINEEVISLLKEINSIKKVWIELGFQTSNEKTAEYIRRGYKNEVFESAVKALNKAGLEVVAHIIIGLPNESEEDALNTVKFIKKCGVKGVKFHLLHVLKSTDLEKDFSDGKFETLTLEKYTEILKKCIAEIGDEIVIHRLTGDGAKKDLVSPLWSADKKKVLNYINKQLLT